MIQQSPTVVRRNSHHALRFQVTCEQIGDECRVVIAPETRTAHLLPSTREPYQGRGQVSEHPTMRVYDDFLTNPRAKAEHLGKITHICIDRPDLGIPRHLVSVVETRSNVMLFPAWGTAPWNSLKPEAHLTPDATIGHITWNKEGKERRLHLTGGARAGGKKDHVASEFRLEEPDETGLHTARLSIYSLDKLDPLAMPYIRVPTTDWQSRDVRSVQASMNAALTRNSSVVRLPVEWESAGEAHLEACVGMKRGVFGNEPLARPARNAPQASPVEQILKVPLRAPWNMIIQLRLIQGRAARDFGWAPGGVLPSV